MANFSTERDFEPVKNTPVRLSVLIPCRNERNEIEAVLQSVLSQELEEPFEILVMDGMSDDGTREILRTLANGHSRIRVIDNPGRVVSSALNLGIRMARGDIVVRMDAHTTYAPDYLRQCLTTLDETGADNVGGPWVAKGETTKERAIAAAFGSPFSAGGAKGHDRTFTGPVDTVYLGCWRREYLLAIGGFDEELDRNQDDELNLRITRQGGRIWQSAKIRSWYRPRGSFRRLLRQYRQYGYWKIRVIQKHRLPASIRHVVPGSALAGAIVLGLLAPFSAWAGWTLSGLAATYLAISIAASAHVARNDWSLFPILPIVFGCFHLGYGWGFLSGAFNFLVLRRQPPRQYAELTR